jgi:hypothetical protein
MSNKNHLNLFSLWNPKMAFSLVILMATGLDALEFGVNNNQNQFGLNNDLAPRPREYGLFRQNNNNNGFQGFDTVGGHFGNKVGDNNKPIGESLTSKCVETNGRMYCM